MMTPVAVKPDYLYRDKQITFLESRYKKNAQDMIIPRMLSSEYLQRFREHGDIGDVLRAKAAAEQSLRAMPRENAAGDLALASADLTLHRFRQARALVTDAQHIEPYSDDLQMEGASFDLELGYYERVKSTIDKYEGKITIPSTVTIARYDEITGHVADAERILTRAMSYSDSIYDQPAERRAWYHFRLGELRYLLGDNAGAIASEHDALAIYPGDFNAYNALSRIELANKQFAAAAQDAKTGSAIIPQPDILTTLNEAQLNLGEKNEAAATRAEIDAVARIGNTQHVNDRLLALYDAFDGGKPLEAYAIAKREVAVRDDIYAEDTLAWCAVAAGHWNEARVAIRKALRYNTEDPRIQYHGAVIAQHFGNRAEAKSRYTRALALNPTFSWSDADNARRQLQILQ